MMLVDMRSFGLFLEDAEIRTSGRKNKRPKQFSKRLHGPVRSVPSLGNPDPHLVHGSLDSRVSPQMASQLVQPFLHSWPLCPQDTHTQTMLCVTSLAIGRIYALHATAA